MGNLLASSGLTQMSEVSAGKAGLVFGSSHVSGLGCTACLCSIWLLIVQMVSTGFSPWKLWGPKQKETMSWDLGLDSCNVTYTNYLVNSSHKGSPNSRCGNTDPRSWRDDLQRLLFCKMLLVYKIFIYIHLYTYSKEKNAHGTSLSTAVFSLNDSCRMDIFPSLTSSKWCWTS